MAIAGPVVLLGCSGAQVDREACYGAAKAPFEAALASCEAEGLTFDECEPQLQAALGDVRRNQEKCP